MKEGLLGCCVCALGTGIAGRTAVDGAVWAGAGIGLGAGAAVGAGAGPALGVAAAKDVPTLVGK
ncbi:hypothetical protein TomMM35A_02850 [Sphingobium sp. TomMM35A]